MAATEQSNEGFRQVAEWGSRKSETGVGRGKINFCGINIEFKWRRKFRVRK
jgi:hypothetical protein